MNYSRNWLFISDVNQKRLAEVKILIAGLGIGSVFAEVALRTGFKRFIIADGDCIDASNLNRQNYTTHSLGQNKAFACAERLRSIAPDVEIEVIQAYLTDKTLGTVIKSCDFAINTIDFDAAEFELFSHYCQKHHKIELFPINLGFGAVVTILDETTLMWRDKFSGSTITNLKEAILAHILTSTAIAPYLKTAATIYFSQAPKPNYDPQLAISTYLVATMLVTTMIRLMRGENIQKFPYFHYLDTYLPSLL